MLSFVSAMSVFGIDAYDVRVEIDISSGLPSTSIVGLPDKAVSEAKERVRSAIKNSGYRYPSGRVTVNLSPGDIKKEGVVFDLPIALGILLASGAIEAQNPEKFVVVGELSLDGLVRRVDGILPMAAAIAANADRIFIVPAENAAEASLAGKIKICPVNTLAEAIDAVTGLSSPKDPDFAFCSDPFVSELDFSEVRGHNGAKRALEIAAAGNHNLLMIGPPGSGKTMLARRLPSILPPLTFEEAIEVTRIYSIKGYMNNNSPIITERPFRAPHCSTSYAGLVGGGTVPVPGEISFAHKGVLFLDELPEFRRDVIEMLRQPMEDGKVVVSRAQHSFCFPASFMLVASMNPCPCGFWGDKSRSCSCSEVGVKKYFNRISGPIMDRIDIHITVPRLPSDEFRLEAKREGSEEIRHRVNRCREIQKKRFVGKKIKWNGELSAREIENFCVCDEQAAQLLYMSMDKMNLTARAYGKILKLSRTIADLEASEQINVNHLAEALHYRSLDRQVF